MLVLIAVLLALIPAVAILYPFLRGAGRAEAAEDEGSTQAELSRRWEAALAGLKSTELEWAIGNLTRDDYSWLRQQYMTEAALVMKAMELEEEQERELMSSVRREVRQVRLRAQGADANGPSVICPTCSTILETHSRECPSCGRSPAVAGPEAVTDGSPSQEVAGE